MTLSSNSLPPAGDDALEARIVAWVLGEASPFEAAELEKLCAENPHLRAFERRIRDLNELLVEDAKPGLHASWQLPEAKRMKITDLLGSAEPGVARLVPDSSDKVVRYFSRRALLVAAACLAISFVSLPIFFSPGVKSKAPASEAGSVGVIAAFDEPAPEMKSSPAPRAAERRMQVLEDAIVKQEDLVEDRRKLLSLIVRSGKYVSDSAQAASDDATDAAHNYTKLEQEKVQLEGQIETLLKYDGNQLLSYAETLKTPDNIIPSLLPQYREAKRQVEVAKASGLGGEHPELAVREKELAGMEQDLQEATVNLRESLKAKHELAKEELARVEARMISKKDEAVKSGLELQNYADAKQDFEAQQRHLEQLKLKLVEEEMNAKVGEQALAANDRSREVKEEVRYKIDARDKKLGSMERGDALAANAPQGPEGPQAMGGPGGPPPPMAAPAAPAVAPTALGDSLHGDLLALQDGEHDIDSRRAGGGGGFGGGMGGGGGALGSAQAGKGPMGGSGPPVDPAKPGQSLAGGKELAEADTPMAGASVTDIVTGGLRSGDGAIARNNIDAILNNPDRDADMKSKSEAAPGSGPAVSSLNAEFDVSGDASRLKKNEGLRVQTAATDRYAAAAKDAKPETASAPAEPQGLAREPALAARDAEDVSHFSRQRGEVEQKGEKAGYAWHVQDEGVKQSFGLADAASGGLKADLSKNLGETDAAVAGDRSSLSTITPGGAGAPAVTGAWKSWGEESSKQQVAGQAGSEKFRSWLASGSSQSPPVLDGTTRMLGGVFNVNGTNFDGFVQYGSPLFADGGAPANPQVRPPGGMPTELDVAQNVPDLNAYYSQAGVAPFGNGQGQAQRFGSNLRLGAERTDFANDSLSFSLSDLPTLQAQSQAQGSVGYRYTADWTDADKPYFSDTQVIEGVGEVPSIATRSGERAQLGITREFIYPKEYQAPELPNAIAGANAFLDPSPGIFPITPATPSAMDDGLAENRMGRVNIEGNTKTDDKVIRREQPLEGGADRSGALAEKGKEAGQLAGDGLAQNPNNADAKRVNEWLDDPIRSNPAQSAGNTESVDKVRRELYMAEGAYNLGKFDDAFRHYEDVIRVDPYNKAARRGMEQVAQARADYYRAAYDHTRAELLAKVDNSWELAVPPVLDAESAKPVDPEVAAKSKADQTRADLLAEVDKAWEAAVPPLAGGRPGADPVTKARLIHLPEFSTGAASVGEVLDELRNKAMASGTDAENLRGIGFAIRKDGVDVENLQVPPIELKDASVSDVLAKISETTGLDLETQGHLLTLKPGPKTKGKQAEQILDKMAEVATATEAFSTFSLHVSDASFKMAKAALDRGEQPAAESIRPEEFYNAFDYGDPAPAQGEPVVCATEQCAHPAVPQRNLLRIGVRTAAAGRGASTPLNLTLLLDSSGSMERPDRQAAMTRAVAQLSGLLKEGDTITVAGFARQPRLLADRLPGARAQELNQIVAQTPSEGGTNLEQGLKLAEELAKRQFNPAAQNRIVLFTDGAANLGDARPEALRGRVEQLRQQNISFDAAGFGADGLNDRLLEQLTRNGNGRYYIVDRAEEAGNNFAKQLAGAFRPAAENVKVQVRFNPARVARYKLLGFEEHRLKKEDFRNDAVDAAEMAAEEAGNAVYQIEPLADGEGQVGEVSVRFRDAASGQMVERTWTIPYEAQAAAFDRATPSIQLAGLAVFAAEKLRQAPLSDALDFKELGKSFPAVKAKYPDSQPVRDLGGMLEKLK